ncbi:hypothetical protein [Pandoraea iniqua]|nr:hypothetical protein [Pandoraea iniqua]
MAKRWLKSGLKPLSRRIDGRRQAVYDESMTDFGRTPARRKAAFVIIL